MAEEGSGAKEGTGVNLVKTAVDLAGYKEKIKGVFEAFDVNKIVAADNKIAALGQALKSVASSNISGWARSISGGIFDIRTAVRAFINDTGSLQAALENMSRIRMYEDQFAPFLKGAGAARQRLAELMDLAGKPFSLGSLVAASRSLEVFTRGAFSSDAALRTIVDSSAHAGQQVEEVSGKVGQLYAGLRDGQPIASTADSLVEMGIVSAQTSRELEAMQERGEPLYETFGLVTREMERASGAGEEASDSVEVLATQSAEAKQALNTAFSGNFAESSKRGTENTIAVMRQLVPVAQSVGRALGGVVTFGENLFSWVGRIVTAIPGLANVAGALTRTVVILGTALSAVSMVRFVQSLMQGAKAIGDFLPAVQKLATQLREQVVEQIKNPRTLAALGGGPEFKAAEKAEKGGEAEGETAAAKVGSTVEKGTASAAGAESAAKAESAAATKAATAAKAEEAAETQLNTAATVESTAAAEANAVAKTEEAAATEAGTLAEAESAAATEVGTAAKVGSTAAAEGMTAAAAGAAVAEGEATVATGAWGAAFLALPWGWIVAGLALVVGAIMEWVSSSREAQRAVDELAKTGAEAVSKLQQQAQAMKTLEDQQDALAASTRELVAARGKLAELKLKGASGKEIAQAQTNVDKLEKEQQDIANSKNLLPSRNYEQVLGQRAQQQLAFKNAEYQAKMSLASPAEQMRLRQEHINEEKSKVQAGTDYQDAEEKAKRDETPFQANLNDINQTVSGYDNRLHIEGSSPEERQKARVEMLARLKEEKKDAEEASEAAMTGPGAGEVPITPADYGWTNEKQAQIGLLETQQQFVGESSTAQENLRNVRLQSKDSIVSGEAEADAEQHRAEAMPEDSDDRKEILKRVAERRQDLEVSKKDLSDPNRAAQITQAEAEQTAARRQMNSNGIELNAQKEIAALRAKGMDAAVQEATIRINALQEQLRLQDNLDEQGKLALQNRIAEQQKQLDVMREEARIQQQADAEHLAIAALTQRETEATVKGNFGEANSARQERIQREDAQANKESLEQKKRGNQYRPQEAIDKERQENLTKDKSQRDAVAEVEGQLTADAIRNGEAAQKPGQPQAIALDSDAIHQQAIQTVLDRTPQTEISAEQAVAGEQQRRQEARQSDRRGFMAQSDRTLTEKELASESDPTKRDAAHQQLQTMQDQDKFRQRVAEAQSHNLAPEEQYKYALRASQDDIAKDTGNSDRAVVASSLASIGGGGGVSMSMVDPSQEQRRTNDLLSAIREDLKKNGVQNNDLPLVFRQ